MRLAKLMISPELLVSMFLDRGEAMTLLAPSGRLEGVVLKSTTYSVHQNVISLYVSHPSLPEVDHYDHAPTLSVEVTKVGDHFDLNVKLP
jgi:hypothetical protein